MNHNRFFAAVLLSALLLYGLLPTLPAAAATSEAKRPDRAHHGSLIRPPFLKPGDTVAVVAVSSKLAEGTDTSFVRRIEAWGVKVKLGEHLFCRDSGWFAGSDRDRAGDLQRMIDDPSVRAILFYKGGYGSVRTLDYLDLKALERHPKWLAGFSDVTVLQYALRKAGVQSIHGAMPVVFLADTLVRDSSALSLRDALFGEVSSYRTAPHPLNRMGSAQGQLSGGNLSLIYALNGTDIDNPLEVPSVLFIEDVGEYIYHIDRMLQTLKRSGKLDRVKAVVVGHFTGIKNQEWWGSRVETLISEYLDPLGIPVLFGFPAGHEQPNYSLYMGRRVSVRVTPEGGVLEFL